MAGNNLIKPTLHVEVLVKANSLSPPVAKELCVAVSNRLVEDCDIVGIGQMVTSFDDIHHGSLVGIVEIADFTGPESHVRDGYCTLQDVQLDVHAYTLKQSPSPEPRREIRQADEDETPQAAIMALPNVAIHEAWNSLVFENALPSRLLRYLVRMVGMMGQTGLNMSTFNWNRLCLLHGPPGSGKSTLCRALAQKLSIRLGDKFARSTLVEINTNSMLSKYFGESGKLITATFEHIQAMAHDKHQLICVVMDEVETIAGSREKVTSGGECSDGLRATNQLLTALDRVRTMPNVIILCTSNLIEAIDSAFVDRVDIKQLIPSPSPHAIYNIFRSCLNELVRSSLVGLSAVEDKATATPTTIKRSASAVPSAQPKPVTRSHPATSPTAARSRSSSPEPWTVVTVPTIPTFSEMMVRFQDEPRLPGSRVWTLARKCEGFSGRTLRRLPILGLAMHTWGGNCSLYDAVSALEAAIEQELLVVKGRSSDMKMEK